MEIYPEFLSNNLDSLDDVFHGFDYVIGEFKKELEKFCLYTSIQIIDSNLDLMNCARSSINSIRKTNSESQKGYDEINRRISIMTEIYHDFQGLYKYFLESINNLNHTKLFPKYYQDDNILIGLIPLIFENEKMSQFYQKILNENNIFSKKYYKPLDNSSKSNNLYKKILCIPLHYDLNFEDINKMINILKINNVDNELC